MKRISLAASAAVFLLAGQAFAQSGAMSPPAADQNAMSQPSSHMSSGMSSNQMSSGQMSSGQMSSGTMHKTAKPAAKTKHAGGMSGPGPAPAAGQSANSSDSMSNPH